MVNALIKERMIHRHERSRSQATREEDKERTEKNSGNSNLNQEPVITPQSAWHEHQIEVRPVPTQNGNGHYFHHNHLAFGIARHQAQKWEDEVDSDVEIEQESIAAFKSAQALIEVDGFLGEVGIPNQHELREPHIGPEDAEAEHELAQIMDVTGVQSPEVASLF